MNEIKCFFIIGILSLVYSYSYCQENIIKDLNSHGTVSNLPQMNNNIRSTVKDNTNNIFSEASKRIQNKSYEKFKPHLKRAFYDAPNGGITNIDFVGNGDIQKSVSQNTGVQANTGLGIIFFRLWENETASGRKRWFQNIEIDFVVNIASTADSIIAQTENGVLLNRRQFGNYILNPVNSKQATFFNFTAYTNNNTDWGKKGKLNWLRTIFSGFDFRFVASNTTWTNQQTVNLSGFLVRAGLFHDFIPDAIRIEKDYSVTLGANYTYRGVLGDVRFNQNQQFRKDILSTDRVRFHGFEVNAGLRFKNIRAEVQIPMIKYRNDEVLGLTNTQFITSIRFVGGFPLKLTGQDRDDRRVTKQ